jgi:hypothetical protein
MGARDPLPPGRATVRKAFLPGQIGLNGSFSAFLYYTNGLFDVKIICSPIGLNGTF